MDLLKFWPIFVAVVAVLVAVVKMIYQQQKSIDWQKEVAPRFIVVETTVARLAGLPDRISALERGQSQLERKVDRLTPRIREVERLREDLDSLDDDVSGVREAVLTKRAPPPRSRRGRTPPAGVPVRISEEITDVNDDDSGGHKR